MKILVTAGNTQTPIDEVRCITNIFSGRTGTRIAWEACRRGHETCLLTSHPEVVEELRLASFRSPAVFAYRTFTDLEKLMDEQVPRGHEAVVHCAAVSDYEVRGVFVPDVGTVYDATTRTWRGGEAGARLADVSGGKVRSRYEELWLRLSPTPKLVDRIRTPWGFTGVLVKFKLEVGVTEERLRRIAEESRKQSDADVMVANTLEGMHDWALLGALEGDYERVSRSELPARLLMEVERLVQARAASRSRV